MQIIYSFLLLSCSLFCIDPLEMQETSEIVNKELPLINFTLTYTCFDAFINEIIQNQLSKEELIEYNNRINSDDDIVIRYRSLLLCPNDPLEDYQRRIEEYCFFYTDATDNYVHDLSFCKGRIEKLFNLLHDINNKARWVFEEQIEELETRYPGIKDMLYGLSGNLTVATKIIRYNKHQSFERPIPYNIVGKSLIWDERLALLWDIGCSNYHKSDTYCYILVSYCLIPGHIPSVVEFPRKNLLEKNKNPSIIIK